MAKVNFKKIFKVKHPVIGMVHFPPLLGYKDYPGIEICLKRSLADAKTLVRGGVNAIMVENNYDTPHQIKVGPETIAAMAFLTDKIAWAINVPLGINVLWSDYQAAFSMAKIVDAKFVRVPVFVDSVRTSYGKIMASPKDVIDYRKNIKAENIAILADIQVKHAEMLQQKTISQSVKQAINNGADAVIITGQWTGEAPDLKNLEQARKIAGQHFPILIGSGADKNNIKALLQFADGVIVSTSLKIGQKQARANQVNIKPWQAKISLARTREFVKLVREA